MHHLPFSFPRPKGKCQVSLEKTAYRAAPGYTQCFEVLSNQMPGHGLLGYLKFTG